MKDNPVAKHARTFNKAHVHRDKKKDKKKGYMKHKKPLRPDNLRGFSFCHKIVYDVRTL